MTLANKFGIDDAAELARVEERISKRNAVELFTSGRLENFPAGKFVTLAEIHRALFAELYDFAGKIRTVNLAKGHFRFASALYLTEAVAHVENMPQKNFDDIAAKYVEMNVAHPFREGNGRSMRIWLDHIFKTELGRVVDWSRVDKAQYLSAMELSPIHDVAIKKVLAAALTDKVDDRELFMKGIDASYFYENYFAYRTRDL
ncbi:MAG: Fic family protein [Quinella sp. 1Q7]|nr:Fic family protein [Quinella sp. 1Q7]